MPKDEAKVSKGYAFIEFSHPMVRQLARGQSFCAGRVGARGGRSQPRPPGRGWPAASSAPRLNLTARPRPASPPPLTPCPAPQEAHAAREQTNGYQLDKNHKFNVR
jgi:hypothetical protein